MLVVLIAFVWVVNLVLLHAILPSGSVVHRASPSVRRDVLLIVFRRLPRLFAVLGVRSSHGLARVGCLSDEAAANSIHKHVLSVQLDLERLPFLNHFVQPLAQVLGLEVRARLRTLELLPGVIVSVDPFIIIEIDILFAILRRCMIVGLLVKFVLIFFVVRQLIQIVFFLHSVVARCKAIGRLFGVQPPLLA